MIQELQGKTILVVDDEAPIRRLVRAMLGTGCVVIEATNGEEGVAMARSSKPDIILMDIMMPKMDGYACCHAIKTNAATRAIPVLMLTGLGFDLNARLAKELGADAYVVKPFSSSDLLGPVRDLLKSASKAPAS